MWRILFVVFLVNIYFYYFLYNQNKFPKIRLLNFRVSLGYSSNEICLIIFLWNKNKICIFLFLVKYNSCFNKVILWKQTNHTSPSEWVFLCLLVGWEISACLVKKSLEPSRKPASITNYDVSTVHENERINKELIHVRNTG